MATYIEMRKKAFGRRLKKEAESYVARSFQTGIRRPLDGIQMKDDTFAFIRVIKEDGTEIPLFGVDKTKGAAYTNFLVSHWEQADMEKLQVVDTFGEDYVYFFGRRPRQYSLTGFLLNTADFNWRGMWWRNYVEYLRGYKLAKMRARAYMYVDGAVIEGYFLNSNVPSDAASPNMVQFSTTMLVTNYVDTTSFTIPTPGKYEYIGGPPANDAGKTKVSDIKGKASAAAKAAKKAKDGAELAKKAYTYGKGLASNYESYKNQVMSTYGEAKDVLKELHGADGKTLVRYGKSAPKAVVGLAEMAH